MAKIMKIDNLLEKARRALDEIIQEVPFAHIDSSRFQELKVKKSGAPFVDGVVVIKLPEKEQILLIETRSSGEPRITREAANQLYRSREKYPGAYGIFIAPYISSRSADVCRKEGIGFIDLAGNCYLSFDRVFINRDGKPNPFSEKRQLRSLFSTKATRIVRVLLNYPGRKWKMEHLAREAEVSIGQVFTVKEVLLDKEWVTAERDGIKVTEPALLLKNWADNYTYKRNQVSDYYTMLPLEECEQKLAFFCEDEHIGYGVSGFSGAARLVPSVKYNRIMIYVQGDRELLVSKFDLKKAESGANVIMMEPYDKGVFYGSTMKDSMRIVSPVQLYLDLYSVPGRGQEAAERLFEEVIGKGW
ncbi:MAG: type IV toxin-antitoxin system AbiEi family antitoxin [Vulcanimicrobiota bacterium]